MVPRPKVSIIIACKNNASAARECLQSVADQTYPNIELIVIDNFSTDGTTDIARQFTKKIYQLGPERSTQFNYGFTKSTGELIYRIGMEFVLEPDLVEKAVAKIHQGYDALAIHNRSIGDSIWAKVRYLERESYKNDNSIVAVRFMKRDVFASVGGFDESLVAGEDFDIHNRIVAAGYKWDHLDATETHIGEPKTIKDVWDKFYYYGRTIRRYQTKSGARGKQQLGFFRPSFKKFQRDLIKTPKLFVAFWFYMVVKYAAGAAGVLRGAPSSLHTTTTTLTPKESSVNPAARPLVSVIVPTKNSAKFLGACLESIKSQTYPQIELIVVDNHSTDTTLAIAKRFTEHVFTHGPERSAQVNFGAEKAKGEYVYKVDSDFVLDPNVVQQCIDKAAEGFDAVVVHNTPDARVSWIAKIRKFEVDMYKNDITHSSARFVSKEVYESIHGFDESITAGEDYDFQNRLNRAKYKTGFIDAEALHLGEPTKLWPHLVKYFEYGRDFVNYRRKNGRESKQQLAFTRSVYLVNWRKFVHRPVIGIAFVSYSLLKYAAGGFGYLIGIFNKA